MKEILCTRVLHFRIKQILEQEINEDLILHSNITHLLLLVVVDDVLVSRAGLCEGVKVVHMEHVPPQVLQLLGDVKVSKIFPCKSITW